MEDILVRSLSYVELALCLAALLFLVRSGAARKFRSLLVFLIVRFTASSIGLPLLYMAQKHTDRVPVLYALYFYVYWASYAIEGILTLAVVYSIFRLAMAPLKGLQTLGTLIFRWAAAISAAVAIGMAFTPHEAGKDFFISVVTQLQQTASILTLCLLLFVCFAIRPMGLSYSSRIFGISFGLGLMAATNLSASAWFMQTPKFYSTVSIVSGVVACLTMLTWSLYFALPEPKRRIIVLPTTSPFLRWNQISAALGDEPGYVAVGGIPPEVFAPAEIEVMRRTSKKLAENEAANAMEPAALHSLIA